MNKDQTKDHPLPNKGREGLGMKPNKYYNSSSKKEGRTMIVEKVRGAEEGERL